jgi:hypothetical protein
VLLVRAFGGLAEITGDWEHDAIAYHLLGPKVWLYQELVRPVLDNSHTAFPATAELLFTALIAIGGPLAPGFSATLTLALFFTLVLAMARRVGLDERGAWWCVAIVAAMPAVYAGAHSGVVDVCDMRRGLVVRSGVSDFCVVSRNTVDWRLVFEGSGFIGCSDPKANHRVPSSFTAHATTPLLLKRG